MGGAIDLGSWLAERTQAERAVIARLWALPEELSASINSMAEAMLQPDVVRAAVASLGQRERAALAKVQGYGGSLAAPVLEREFGTIRAADQYPNPRAYLLALDAPPTPTERLYVLGLIQHVRSGMVRSYEIAPDLLALLPPVPAVEARVRVQPVEPPAEPQLADRSMFEQSLLLLLSLAHEGKLDVLPTGGLNKASLLRLAREWQPGATLQGVTREEQIPYVQFLRSVAEGTGLLRAGADAKLRPTRTALEWMRLGPVDRARRLLEGWAQSPFDELTSFSGMKFQRAYGRDVARARRALLRMLAQVPGGEWIAFADFTSAVKAVEPDYARPHGMYDTWGILSYLRVPLDGFDRWDDVEGEQIRAVIAISLAWLGLVDLGVHDEAPVSFRLNPLGAAVLQNAPLPDDMPVEPLVVQPNFEVIVPPYAALYDRFQIARIADRTRRGDVELFTLTKRALQEALGRGIPFEDIERFLYDASNHVVPQNVVATLREWAGQHGQVRLRRAVVLETQDAAIMEQIRRDKRLRFPSAERVTATTFLLREGDAPPLAERLKKAGYGLAEGELDVETPLSEHDMTVLLAALEFYAEACAELGMESDASGALRRRVAKLLPDKQLNRAYRTAAEARRRLRAALEHEIQER